MKEIYTPNGSIRNNLLIEKKKIKTLKVVGEATGQLVIKNATCINAIKIDRINAQLLDSTDNLFRNKIIKQGTIRKEIFYINQDNKLRFMTEDIPFTLTIDIPDFKPTTSTETQNHLVDIDVNYSLTPANQCIPGCLRQIIVAHISVTAAEWTQIDVITRLDSFPKIYSAKSIYKYSIN